MTTPTERMLSALVNRNCDPKQNGKGWSAQCPAHEDRRPSLSVSEGDDGRALVRCHAGCTVDAICNAVGLRLTDLMTDKPSTLSTSTQPREPQGKRQYRRQPNGKPAATYKTAKAAVAALERTHGKLSALWTYHDALGDPMGVIVRWDNANGKDIRPVARCGDGWRIGGMAGPRPLYCLPELTGADRVYICEGEKAADAARAIGLTATTSAHGSQSPDKTDWSPLAGKECVILPDKDEPGGKYADMVLTILAKLSPPAVVKVVELPDLPDHGDIADWIDAHGEAAEPDDLRRQVEELAANVEEILPHRSATRIERFRPFPTDALPEPICGFVKGGAKAIGCDESYLALPLLTALAAAIGNTRRLQIKRGWYAPAIVWTAIVGESGAAKSPAFRLVMAPLRERQGRALERYDEALAEYKNEEQRFKVKQEQWKAAQKKGGGDDPPEAPTPPEAERCIVSDTTVEALAPILLANPRGLMLTRDELAGWLGSFDRYAGGKGSADAAHWLSMFNGESIIVDRKTGIPRTIFVPHASISITGGIQPSILNRALGTEHRESGLAARFLLTCPPPIPKRWTEDDIDPDAERELAELFDRLHELKAATGDDEKPTAALVRMNSEAKVEWIAHYNAHNLEQSELTGDLAAAWSKLEEYPARLALLVHFVRWANKDTTLASVASLDADSISAGIRLTEWFKYETRRVYAMLAEPDESREQRRLVEWIGRKGGSVTAREVQQGQRWIETSDQATEELTKLVKAGHGEWEPTPPGQRGQPTRRFVLASTVYGNRRKPRENRNTVDVDSVDTPETQTDDDWGEL